MTAAHDQVQTLHILPHVPEHDPCEDGLEATRVTA